MKKNKEEKIFRNRSLFVFVALALLVTGAVVLACAPTPTPVPPTPPPPTSVPTTEANKALVRRYVEQVLNRGKFEVLDELWAPNYKRYVSAAAAPLNADAAKKRLAGLRAVFPDLNLTIEDMIAEGDRVAYRTTIRGTQQAAYQGIAPTGKQVTVTELAIIRIENGKFVEHWGGADTMDLVQQLGAVVSPAPPK